jgi:alpha-D-ribose 1-methylphosphonate 5-triphosphate synthase subunit PhnG
MIRRLIMKIRQILVLTLCLLFLGMNCQPVKAQGQLRVLASKTVLRRGETGTITIQGKANTSYTINTSYVLGNREIGVSQMRTTDENGQATFNWVVDTKTALGTRSAVISGGGERIELSHTVTE